MSKRFRRAFRDKLCSGSRCCYASDSVERRPSNQRTAYRNYPATGSRQSLPLVAKSLRLREGASSCRKAENDSHSATGADQADASEMELQFYSVPTIMAMAKQQPLTSFLKKPIKVK